MAEVPQVPSKGPSIQQPFSRGQATGLLPPRAVERQMRVAVRASAYERFKRQAVSTAAKDGLFLL